MIVENQNIGTVGGKQITKKMLDSYTDTFEKDWLDSEVNIIPTERGRVLRALAELNIPIYEVEALERRANHKQQPLILYIHSILKQELIVNND
jgi:hypothetical protein